MGDINRLKIAILISGRVNTNIEQYNNTVNTVFRDNDIDIFISHQKTEPEQLSKFIELYKPKKMIESNEIIFDVSKYPKAFETNSSSVMYMHLNRKNVFNIFEEYVKQTKMGI